MKVNEPKGSLLCVGAFPSNTGFAWDFIESLYVGVAERLAASSVTTWVSYPELDGAPQTLERSSARAVALSVDFMRPAAIMELLRFIRERNVRVLYMADRPAWHPTYALLRRAGVRWIVVHNHTSGDRTRRQGFTLRLKRLTRKLPGTLADRVIAVSDFVARRIREVDLVPERRLTRIWNAVRPPVGSRGEAAAFVARFHLPSDRPLVLCVARSVREKGVHHLFRAFDEMVSRNAFDPVPLLVYLGTGPWYQGLEAVREGLRHREHIRMLGYVEGASRFLGAATLAVVPSVWQEAFGLAALEPMAHGVSVIASAVGGLPEVVVDGQTGVLVPPGDEGALASAMQELLLDDDLRQTMGSAGRERALQHFDFEQEVEEIYRLVMEGFEAPAASTSSDVTTPIGPGPETSSR